MKSSLKILSLLLLLTCNPLKSNCQGPEELYLHCDRDTYAAGENIFIRAYLFGRDSLVLSGTSSFAYIELLSPLNRPVAQVRVYLDKGKGSTMLSIPDTVMNGLYVLRAYTSLMKNFMPFDCFMKDLTILNPFSNSFADLNFSRRPGDPFYVDFWPEGGQLIAGIPSRIGIHASEKSGNPAILSGSIVDDLGNVICSVNTDSSGLGTVDLVPGNGRSYSAINEKNKKRFTLPPVLNEGMSVSIESQTPDSLKIVLHKVTGHDPGNWFSTISVLSSGRVIFNTRETIADGRKKIVIPSSVLGKGINIIQARDAYGNLSAWRFLYRHGPGTDILSDDPVSQFGKREKVQIDLKPEDFNVQGPLDDLSLSITACSPGRYVTTMSEYLVFGSVYRIDHFRYNLAETYFGSKPAQREILLLGLRYNNTEYQYEGSRKPSGEPFLAEKGGQYLTISGLQSTRNDDGILRPAFMSVPGKSAQLRYSLPDKKNNYLFFIEQGDEEKDIVIQLPDSVSRSGFKVESPFSREIIPSDFQPDTTRPLVPDFYNRLAGNFQLMKIYEIPSTGDREAGQQAGNKITRFYGKPDQELVLKDYISLPAMQEVFFELIPGVSLRTGNSTVKIQIIDPRTNTLIEGEPLVLVDGVPVKDPSCLLNINPEKAEKIDIVASEYLMGDLIFHGIINVITKAADLSDIPPQQNSIRLRHRLYDPPSGFISPDHSGESLSEKRVPDFRNTLYWHYALKPKEDGTARAEFFTSDIPASYIIIIAGTDLSGKPVSARRLIQVK